jgi:hypothetical protein
MRWLLPVVGLFLLHCSSEPEGPGTSAPGVVAQADLVATIHGVSRTLPRAQFGYDRSDDGSTLYVEAHEGGASDCPETQQPKRTLVVSGVPVGEPGKTFTETDGVRVVLFDFTGDQFDDVRPIEATAATVTIVKLGDEASAEVAVDATFAEGSVKGPIRATYCSAMTQ